MGTQGRVFNFLLQTSPRYPLSFRAPTGGPDLLYEKKRWRSSTGGKSAEIFLTDRKKEAGIFPGISAAAVALSYYCGKEVSRG